LAQTALAQAQAALEMARARLSQTVIPAPADGVLIGREVEPGNVAQPGKELMVLAPAGETQIVVQIDEKNLSQLSIGQKAIASADAYPRERFNAELFYINPGIDALRGSVEVKLRVPQPPPYLRQDMTVSVDIEVGRRSGALIAPSDAIHDAATVQPYVLIAAGGRATKRPVTLGLKGDGHVEIKDGVMAGDQLIPSAAGVAVGQRVRAFSEKRRDPS
jgi:HlyD family secretion protein